MKRSCIFGSENKKLHFSNKTNESFRSQRGDVTVTSHRLWDELRQELIPSSSVSCKRSKSLTSHPTVVAEPTYDLRILERSQSWDGCLSSSSSSKDHEHVNVGDTIVPTAPYPIAGKPPQQVETVGTPPETKL